MTRTVIVNLEVVATIDDDRFLAPHIADAIEKWARQPDVREGSNPPRAVILYQPESAPGVMVKTTATWRRA